MTEPRDPGPEARDPGADPEGILEDLATGQGIDRSPDAIPAEDIVQLAGIRDPARQTAVAGADEIDHLGEMTDTGIYQGDLEARAADDDQPDEPPEENLELLIEDEFRAGETHDAGEAAEEGMAWVPPVDPPIVPGEDGQVEVGAGFGATADDEPFDADHHDSFELRDDERTSRVWEALRAHAATTGLVDRLSLETEGSVVIVGGTVDDVLDEDEVLGVIAEVDGVSDVVSRIRVETLG